MPVASGRETAAATRERPWARHSDHESRASTQGVPSPEVLFVWNYFGAATPTPSPPPQPLWILLSTPQAGSCGGRVQRERPGAEGAVEAKAMACLPEQRSQRCSRPHLKSP